MIRIARILSAADYGRYTFIITAVAIAQVFSSLALRNISIREISRHPFALPIVARKSSKPIIAATMFAGLALVAYLGFSGEIHSPALLLMVFMFLVAQSCWEFSETLAFSRSQMQVSAWLYVLSSAAWLMIVFIIPARLLTLDVILGTFVGVQLTRSVCYFVWEWRAHYFTPKDVPEEYTVSSRGLLMQSLPILGTNLLSLPISQLPLMFLAKNSGMNEVGYFGIGGKLTQPVQTIVASFFPVIFPLLSAGSFQDPASFKRQIEKIFMMLAFGGIAIAVSISLLGHEIITLFFGDKYISAVSPLSLQLWIAVQSIMFGFIGLLFIVMNKERTMVRLSLVNALLIGSFSFIGSHYGAAGLAMYLVVSGGLGFAIHWYYVKRMLPDSIGFRKEIAVFATYAALCTMSYLAIGYPLVIRLGLFIIALTSLAIIFRTEINEIAGIATGAIRKIIRRRS